MYSLIRVGNTIINLATVTKIDLDWEEEGEHWVVLEFISRGSEEAQEGAAGPSSPRIEVFSGEEAEVLRRHLKKLVPDLLRDD